MDIVADQYAHISIIHTLVACKLSITYLVSVAEHARIRNVLSETFLLPFFYEGREDPNHGWASAELPRNRVNVNLFLRHIRDLSRFSGIVTQKPNKGRYSRLF